MENKEISEEKDLAKPIIRLGLACNEKCLFCNVPPESCEISGREYAQNFIMKSPSGSMIALSGGEPTLYPFLPEIINLSRQRGIYVELQTNAILLADMNKVKELKNAGLERAFVSLHSHIAPINDFLTGTKGSWEKGICGIHNLLSAGITVSVNIVLTTVNYSGIADFVIFMSRKLNAKHLSLSVIQPRGRAWANNVLVPDYTVLDKPVRKALKIASRENLMIINPSCGLPLCVGGWEQVPEQCMEYVQASLGQNFVKGKVYSNRCASCAAKKFCAGVWQEYYELRGDSSLKPFKNF